jgi:hypothetical protein
MTDYRPLLSRAITGLDPNTGEARRAIYDRARTALINQLRGINPPLSEADITRERLALEDAIRKVEAEAGASRAAPPQPAPPRDPRMPRTEPASPRPAPVSANDRDPEDDYEDDEPEAAPPPPRDPRMPRNDPRNDPRGPRPQARQEPSLRPRGARSRSPQDYARDDARRASRTKFIVFGIILLLLLLAGAVGYIHRDRIRAIVANLGTQQTAQDVQTPTQNKAADRLPQQQTQAPTPNTSPPPADTRRAFLFEENPGSQQFTTINGTVNWRTETVNPGPGKSPELGVRIDVDIPERKMQVVVTIRRNPDTSLPATHYIEIQFVGNDSFGGVAQVPVMRMKNNEAAQGIPLAGISIRVMQGFFLIGLSAAETDRDRNLQVMKTLNWLDIPFIYNNGRRAVVTFEKGAAGEKILAEAFAAWGNL